jgi:hypothetical protein
MERKGGEGKCASLSMERTVARIVEPKAADSKTAGVCHGFASSVLARLRPLLCVCVCVYSKGAYYSGTQGICSSRSGARREALASGRQHTELQ